MKIDFKNINNQQSARIIGIYYFILLLIALSWTTRELIEPNVFVRYLYLLLFVLPFIKYPNLAPTLITIFLTVRSFSVAPYGYLPTQVYIYLYMAFALYLFHSSYGLISPKTNKTFIVLLLVAIFSNLINHVTEPEGPFEYDFVRLLLIIILLSKLLDSGKDIILMEWGFVIITFCLSIYGLVFYEDFIAKTVDNQEFGRIYWTDPNYLGSILCIGMVVSFYNLMNYHNFKRISRIFFLATFIVGLFNLGFLASRGAFLTLVIPVFYILYKKTKSTKNVFLALLIIGIIIFAFLNLLVFESLIDRFKYEDTLSTGSGRTIIWKNSFEYFIKSDFITLFFGGGGTYSLKICGYITNEPLFSPHNNFLEILYNYGIVGLIIFIVLLINWFRRYYKNVLAVSLIFVLILSSLTLSPLMYAPFWFLIILIENQKLKEIE